MDIICPYAAELVNKVFTVFYAICNGFEKQYVDPNKLRLQKMQWAIAFMEENITKWDEIESAVSHCRKLTGLIYTPTIGDFLSYRKKNIQNEITPFEIAYVECCQKSHPSSDRDNWSHPVVFHSWSEMKSSNFLNRPEKESRKMYEHYYHHTKKMFLEGKPLKTIQKALEGPVDDDPYKTLKRYGGVLPQYAHLTSCDKAMPVIKELLKKMESKFLNR